MIQIRQRFALLTTVALLASTGLVSAAEPRGAVMGATGGAALTTRPAGGAATPGSPGATGPATGTPSGAGVGATVYGPAPTQGPVAAPARGVSGLPSCTTNPSTSISAANSGQAMSDTSTGANLNGSGTTGSGSSTSPGC